jgi:hypothetical protein
MCAFPGGPVFVVPAPVGYPTSLGPDDTFHHQYRFSTPLGSVSPIDATRCLINNPTPGDSFPATLVGTQNSAALALGFINSVISYITPDLKTGNQLVVNITNPGSILEPGYVVREVSNGSITTYGEGLSPWQDPYLFGLPQLLEGNAWNTQSQSLLSKCSCGK